jgi:outer membrane protein assembly factor BamD
VEYKDFQTFFPTMPEAAEAQLKVAKIHYRQMEKPDRDFAQAMRAADEYKTLIQQYPDSSLVPEAKQRLREVQEDLAERQYRIAHFYYLRENLAASQARLQSLVDSYPLYSGIDQALFELGGLYEKEAATMQRQNMRADVKEKMVTDFQKHAIDAYSRIIIRYPAKDRAGDARRRLQALKAPVPTPTAEAIAESKAEEQSRRSIKMSEKAMGNFQKHPNLARSARVGDPSMDEEEVKSAAKMVQDLNAQLTNAAQGSNQQLSIETVGSGSGAAPGPNQPAPSSQPKAGTGATGSQPADGAPPTPALPQVNEVQKSSTTDPPAAGQTTPSSTDNKQDSTSKKKTKKGLRKLIPF